jgi:hypothetical protein
LFTTWLKVADVLPTKLEEPAVYTAFTLCVAVVKLLLEYVPKPLLSVTALPTLLPSMLNCTVPVGTSDPLVTATVAVNVTAAEYAEGFADELTVVVVLTAPAVPVRLAVWVVPATLSELSARISDPEMLPATVGAKSTP